MFVNKSGLNFCIINIPEWQSIGVSWMRFQFPIVNDRGFSVFSHRNHPWQDLWWGFRRLYRTAWFERREMTWDRTDFSANPDNQKLWWMEWICMWPAPTESTFEYHPDCAWYSNPFRQMPAIDSHQKSCAYAMSLWTHGIEIQSRRILSFPAVV